MRRCAYLAFLLLVFAIKLSAQTDFRFVDSTAQWNVLSIYHPLCDCIYYSTDIYSVVGDTAIGPFQYQIIKKQGQPSYECFIRKDSLGKVFFRKTGDSSDVLIYNFGLSSGDSIASNQSCGLMHARIDSMDTLQMGHARKRQFISGYINFTGRPDQFVEGIGSLFSHPFDPLLYYNNLCLVDGPGFSLLCYFEHDSLLYHDTAFSTCVLDSEWTGLETVKNDGVKIFPNPVTENFLTLQLDNNSAQEHVFQLFDITGRIILRKSFIEKTTRIELNEINGGMYFFQINSSQKIFSSGKLAIE